MTFWESLKSLFGSKPPAPPAPAPIIVPAPPIDVNQPTVPITIQGPVVTVPTTHTGIGTDFADPADLRAFQQCKAKGGSDKQCFAVGDNCIGYWGDSTATGSGPCVAVIPEDAVAEWGTLDAAHNQIVRVSCRAAITYARVKDRMPYRRFVKHGAVLDMNPDTCAKLGLRVPVETTISWRRAVGDEGAGQV